ncbi:MAG: hypothetical protein KDB69_05430, partial [Acidimicrobiia bacterium]|nr:hypothetical protein [Acidimicrobiia bacterium]
LAAFGGIFFAMGGGFTLPTTQSIATKSVDDSRRGGVLGTYQASSSLAVILSTAVGGALFSLYPHLPNQVAFVASIVAILRAVLLARMFSRGAARHV